MLRLTVLSISHSKRRKHDAVHGPAIPGALPDAPLGGRLQPGGNGRYRAIPAGTPPIEPRRTLGSSRLTAYDPSHGLQGRENQ